MTVINGDISSFMVGDDLEIERTVTSIPSGVIINTAWLMVKRKFSDTDTDAIISKTITSSDTTDVGWIEDTGADGTGLLRFYITPDETILLTPLSEYQYSIKIKLNNNKLNTPERGVMIAEPAIKIGDT